MTEPIATEPVVSVRALSKTYRVYAKAFDRLVEGVFGGTRHSAFDALQDVSFELEPGEGLAVIGENGAGKSTLLKILAGVTAASAGSLEVKGKVASILELGSGFHPELTGRQNIVLNAAMLGLTPAEVEAKTPEIIAFSELGGFIDQPVKCYSTGMAMRLGFAIATQVEPDVLIIDEALSVGDGYFQKKCMDKLKAYVGGGGTLLFCSHAMYYVSAFCRRALWLRGGRVEALGPVDAVVRSYENFLLQKEAAAAKPAVEPSPSTGPARFLDVAFEAGRREAGRLLYRYREPCTVRLAFEARDAELELHVGVGIDRVDGVQVVNFSTFHDGHPPFTGKHRYELTLEVPELPLLKGEFTAHLFLVDEKALHVYDARTLPQVFSIEAEGFPIGIMRVPHRWQETSPEPAALEAASMG